MDGQITNERDFNLDWNPIWNLQTGRFDGGWSFEAEIPFKSLRYRPGRTQLWGFQAESNHPSPERKRLLDSARPGTGPCRDCPGVAGGDAGRRRDTGQQWAIRDQALCHWWALTPLFVKTVAQAAWVRCWRTRKSVMTRWSISRARKRLRHRMISRLVRPSAVRRAT